MTIHGKPPALHQEFRTALPPPLDLRALIGSGDRIGAFVLPFLVAGTALNIAFPDAFAVGGPPQRLMITSSAVLAVGVVVWAWSVLLLLTTARAGRLITTGPYRLVRHPLYTGVALLVLPDEEVELARRFGPQWDDYRRRVRVGWL